MVEGSMTVIRVSGELAETLLDVLLLQDADHYGQPDAEERTYDQAIAS